MQVPDAFGAAAAVAAQDHPSVHSRAAVKGLASRVVFVDHAQPELQASKATRGQWSSPDEHKSKVNEHEVELATATVIYLLQQVRRWGVRQQRTVQTSCAHAMR